jgi:hypothetical protein
MVFKTIGYRFKSFLAWPDRLGAPRMLRAPFGPLRGQGAFAARPAKDVFGQDAEEVSSSRGRAMVSKTIGYRFKSFLACPDAPFWARFASPARPAAYGHRNPCVCWERPWAHSVSL